MMTADFAALEMWTRRRALLLVAMLFAQFGVAFVFQDFRAILDDAGGLRPDGSAFAISGGPPVEQKAAAPKKFIPFVRPQPDTRPSVSFGPSRDRVVSDDETAPASAGGAVKPLAGQPSETDFQAPPTGSNARSANFAPLSAPISVLASSIPQVEGVSPAPEPGTWILFILGFGVIGLTLRSQRAAADRAGYAAVAQIA